MWHRGGFLTGGAVLAAALASHVAAAPPAPRYVPLVLRVGDLSGDGVADALVGQAREAQPFDALVRMVDGATGRVLWQDVVSYLRTPVATVHLDAGSLGVVLATGYDSGANDVAGRSLRVRVVDGAGAVRWDRSFPATDLAPSPVPSYVRPAFRGVLDRPGAGDLLLVEQLVRVEGAAERLSRLSARLLDATTGEDVSEHRPVDVVHDGAHLTPVPVASGPDGYALVRYPLAQGAGDGSVTLYDAGTGAAAWSTSVRADGDTALRPSVAGAPARAAVAVTSATRDLGVQLLDPATGDPVVRRTEGGPVELVDGTGAAGRLRTQYVSRPGQSNGYTVELLDLLGRDVRRRFFPVGAADTYAVVDVGFYEAGDLDGDGWHDLLAHVLYSGAGSAASDDRVVDGRTLESVEVSPALEALAWSGAGSAAVDGRGDDVYVPAGRRGVVRDGRTLRPLLSLTTVRTLGPAFGVRDLGARCADVVVVTYEADRFELTRLGTDGRPRWSTRTGEVAAKDVSSGSGCPGGPRPVASPPATPGRGPTLPATGGVASPVVWWLVAAVAWRWRRGIGYASRHV